MQTMCNVTLLTIDPHIVFYTGEKVQPTQYDREELIKLWAVIKFRRGQSKCMTFVIIIHGGPNLCKARNLIKTMT